MKKLVGIFFTVILFMLQNNVIYASNVDVNEENVLDQKIVERVYEELQSGNITNYEDLLNVAI